MKTLVGALALSLSVATGAPGVIGGPGSGAAHAAGPIHDACLRSDRAAGRSLCRCIQKAADGTLSRRDQRAAAQFFRDPHKAQEVRMSKRRSDNAFWSRYRVFGSVAERTCHTFG